MSLVFTVGPDGNLCRDPSGYGTIWCYTLDPEVRWDACSQEVVPSRKSRSQQPFYYKRGLISRGGDGGGGGGDYGGGGGGTSGSDVASVNPGGREMCGGYASKMLALQAENAALLKEIERLQIASARP